MDTKEFLKGKAPDSYTFFGSHKKVKGYIFRTIAPHAKTVEIIGDFNDWTPDKLRGYSTGVFSITCKNAKALDRYQFIITDHDGNKTKKIDPFARKILVEDDSALVVDDFYEFENDRTSHESLNIYQVHMGTLLKGPGNSVEDKLNKLIDHAKANNFSHISFMPVTEFSSYKSMGYASTGLFAYSDRYGQPLDFKKFIDRAHGEGLGIIVELDLSEFDPSPNYLNNYDGRPLFEYDYEDIKYNYYGSMNFDPAKDLVKSYLKSAVDYWIRVFNLDGIYFSNIQNMVYWQGARDRGINQDWVDLLDELIDLVHKNKALALGSFDGIYDLDLKLDYVYDSRIRKLVSLFQKSPEKRDSYKLDIQKLIASDNSRCIFGFSYIDSFLNEANIAMKMYGENEKNKQLMTLLTFVYGQNSAKMVFMGDEVASLKTWSMYEPMDVSNIDERQKYFNSYYKDLAKLYHENPAFSNPNSHSQILDVTGYSVYCYIRKYENQQFLIINNLTDIDYSLISPYKMEEVLNTDDLSYGGKGNINGNIKENEKINIGAFGSCIFAIKKRDEI